MENEDTSGLKILFPVYKSLVFMIENGYSSVRKSILVVIYT
ncbi:Uncharacterised protein [Segatella oris]|uniref:Uncharacterized protein n=1 Tax=Segatella oris TaxID=28135 RepID=A0A448L9B7_9BACT|nr:Uncharacterised protein [Segatella oris]